MKLIIVRSGVYDPNQGPQARFRRMISCHEAGHALAAYHVRFPFIQVRFTEPQGLNSGDNHLEPDSQSIDVTLRFLHHEGQTVQRLAIAYGAVLRMGLAVNLAINFANVAEAQKGAAWDQQQLTDFFNDRGFDQQTRIWLSTQIDIEVTRIFNLPSFTNAVDAVAAALIARKSLTMDEVATIVELAVGQQLANTSPIPTHGNIALSSYYRRLSLGVFPGNHLEDWFAAEKGLRFGYALI